MKYSISFISLLCLLMVGCESNSITDAAKKAESAVVILYEENLQDTLLIKTFSDKEDLIKIAELFNTEPNTTDEAKEGTVIYLGKKEKLLELHFVLEPTGNDKADQALSEAGVEYFLELKSQAMNYSTNKEEIKKPATPVKVYTLTDLHFLIGTWEMRAKTDSEPMIETWTLSEEGTLLGSGSVQKDGETVIVEDLKLVQEGDDVYYMARVLKQNDGSSA